MNTDPAVLAVMFAWFSPAFPTGGFAYSHGLECAVAEGLVNTEAELGDWIEGVLLYGGGWNDAVLLAAAHRAVDGPALQDLAELAAAIAVSKERLAETLSQGSAFLLAVRAGWPDAACRGLEDATALPVAAGAAAATIGAPLTLVLTAYLNGLTASLIAAGLRLNLYGQTAAARLLAALGPTVATLAMRAVTSSLGDLGGCALGSDIAAMRHEALPSRLFIS